MKLFKHLIFIGATVIFVSSCSKKNDPNPQPTPPNGALSITSISPAYGKAGTEVTITGTHFSTTAANNTVTLGGKTATVTVASATQLKINVPTDATHGTIEVKSGTNVATSEMFYYEPIVSSLSATSGKVGDLVVITGQHFGTIPTDFEVKFNGILAEVTVATATTLSAKVPTGATAGLVTVARKTKAPVNGPTFSVGGGGTPGTSADFTINNGSVAITKLLTDKDGYGEILCMAIDDTRNVAYAGTKTDIVKIDLTTNTVSSVIQNSTYLTTAYGKPSAIDVDANGKLYVLSSTTLAIPTVGTNVFIVDPVAKTGKVAGNRFVGFPITPNGSFATNTPFVVMGNGEIIAFDQSGKELCKFSADLTVRTVIHTMPLLENIVQLIKVDQNTVRIVLANVTNDRYYYDYSGTMSSKKDFGSPTGFNMISQTIGGTNKYGVAGEKIDNNVIPRTTFTVGRLNAAQTGWEKSGSFIIESFEQTGTLKFYGTIGLNGKNYFYADKNGNMYAHTIGSGAGIYKISLN